jgi:Tol biopolymer transport system component
MCPGEKNEVVKKIFFHTLLLITGFSVPSYAQYFSTGQDPASLHWRQIRTKNFQLIYPQDFEKKGQYLANLLEIVQRNETKTLSAKVPRIPFVIHSRSTISNGITPWAPKRIELYSCPPQTIYAEEWLEQLAIHECRHTVQYSKMNRGFTRVLTYIFGEQATAAILGLFIPFWFLEGDAVCTETALSDAGRGRTSAFENVLRAQLLEKGIWSYDKAVLGSYRTFIPDHYELGYPLVAEARKTYGPVIWNTALDRTAKLPFMIVPFSSGIHKVTGLPKVKFYKKMLSNLTDEWKTQEKAVDYTTFIPVTKKDSKNHPAYIHPVFLNDSVIIAEKTCINDPDRIVQINRKTGKEKKIVTMGTAQDESVSVKGKILAWSEVQPDARWQNRDYSVIRIHDLQSGRTRNLTRRTRYFAPSVSPDATQIATVRLDTQDHCSIDILELPGGKTVKSFPMEKNALALTPNWSPDGKNLVFTILNEKGKSLAGLNIRTGIIRNYLPFSFTEISGPACYNKNNLFYTADYSGIGNIYTVDTSTQKISQVTSSRFYATNPDFTRNHDEMIYSDYSSDGLDVVEAKIDTALWIPLDKITDSSVKLYQTLVQQEQVNIQDSIRNRRIYKLYESDTCDLVKDTIEGKFFTSKKYKRFLHLFNLHSWEPATFDVNNLTLKPGVSVLSQNVLSSMSANAGWEYNTSEATGKVFANISYQGLYPVFDLGFDFGNRAAYYLAGKNELIRFTWQEMNFKLHTSIPWNFSRGKYYRFLTPFIGTTMIAIAHNASTPSQLTRGLITTIDYQLSFTQYLRPSLKDMYPRLGQTIDLNFRNTPFAGNQMGDIFAAQTNLWFPGFFRHQGIWAYGGYQSYHRRNDTFYTYASIINFPRGYLGFMDEQVMSVALNYKLPLFYPDLSLGSLVYFKRFKLNLFFDWAQGWSGKEVNIYQSTGAELTTDLHLLRFLFPFDLGVRMLFFPGNSSWGWEFLYAINI